MAAFGVGEAVGFIMLEWFATFFWSVDFFLWFRTGYFVGSSIETRPKRIALHYAKTWMSIDLVIVTLEWVNRLLYSIGSASLLRSSRVFRTIRFIKLLRLAKMKELWSILTEQVNSNVFHLLCTMTVLSTILLIIIHIMSCVWYAIGNSRDDGWIGYDKYEGRKDTLFWYIASARWVISQLNGRTDMREDRNMQERLFTCIVGVSLAVLAQAVFISIITKTMLDLSELVSEKTRRRRLVNDYLETHPVPPALNSSVKRYLTDYKDGDKEQENENIILSILPKHVQTQLLFEVRSPVLVAHPLFSNLNDEFQWFMRYLCRKVVKLATAVKYDVVFDKGEACSRMLFMDKVIGRYGDPFSDTGRQKQPWNTEVEDGPSPFTALQSMGGEAMGPQAMSMKGNTSMKATPKLQTSPSTFLAACDGIRIDPGTWICEPALWTEWLNRGRLVAANHGHLFSIDSTDLANGLQKNTDAFALTVLYARAFV